jgi:hypothetical protein
MAASICVIVLLGYAVVRMMREKLLTKGRK